MTDLISSRICCRLALISFAIFCSASFPASDVIVLIHYTTSLDDLTVKLPLRYVGYGLWSTLSRCYEIYDLMGHLGSVRTPLRKKYLQLFNLHPNKTNQNRLPSAVLPCWNFYSVDSLRHVPVRETSCKTFHHDDLHFLEYFWYAWIV